MEKSKNKHASVDDYRLGNYRTSMDTDLLLMKPQLGRPINRCYQLPGETFIYGKPNVAIDGGVAAAMIHTEVDHYIGSKKLKPKDFIKLNKTAVMSGLVTATENKHYRAVNDLRVVTPRVNLDLHKKIKLPPGMTFGIPTRPSTPMFDVMEHKFKEKWLLDRREEELACKAKIKEEKKLLGRYETRATILRRHLPKVKFDNLWSSEYVWRMPKYINARPHLETFETPKLRRASFRSHKIDATSRKGLYGHGIYEPALR